MSKERELFSKRLADAMRTIGYDPRPSVLFKLFNSRYTGPSVSFQSVSRWLNARSIPEQDKLQVLALILDTEPHALRYGAPAARAGGRHDARVADLSPHDREMLDIYLSLHAGHRKLIRDLIGALGAKPPAGSRN